MFKIKKIKKRKQSGLANLVNGRLLEIIIADNNVAPDTLSTLIASGEAPAFFRDRDHSPASSLSDGSKPCPRQ